MAPARRAADHGDLSSRRGVRRCRGARSLPSGSLPLGSLAARGNRFPPRSARGHVVGHRLYPVRRLLRRRQPPGVGHDARAIPDRTAARRRRDGRRLSCARHAGSAGPSRSKILPIRPALEAATARAIRAGGPRDRGPAQSSAHLHAPRLSADHDGHRFSRHGARSKARRWPSVSATGRCQCDEARRGWHADCRERWPPRTTRASFIATSSRRTSSSPTGRLREGPRLRPREAESSRDHRRPRSRCRRIGPGTGVTTARRATCRRSRRWASRWIRGPICSRWVLVLFECLTGELPFVGQSRIRGTCRTSSRAGSSRWPRFGPTSLPQLQAILARCLEHDPGKRLDSASWLAGAARPDRTRAQGFGAVEVGVQGCLGGGHRLAGDRLLGRPRKVRTGQRSPSSGVSRRHSVRKPTAICRLMVSGCRSSPSNEASAACSCSRSRTASRCG